MKQNVTYDFTQIGSNEDQPVAIMPSWLAIQLLKQLSLAPATANQIVGRFIDDLRDNINDLPKSVEIAREFVQTRELIDNVKKENWSAYATEQPVKVTEICPVDYPQAKVVGKVNLSNFS